MLHTTINLLTAQSVEQESTDLQTMYIHAITALLEHIIAIMMLPRTQNIMIPIKIAKYASVENTRRLKRLQVVKIVQQVGHVRSTNMMAHHGQARTNM